MQQNIKQPQHINNTKTITTQEYESKRNNNTTNTTQTRTKTNTAKTKIKRAANKLLIIKFCCLNFYQKYKKISS